MHTVGSFFLFGGNSSEHQRYKLINLMYCGKLDGNYKQPHNIVI